MGVRVFGVNKVQSLRRIWGPPVIDVKKSKYFLRVESPLLLTFRDKRDSPPLIGRRLIGQPLIGRNLPTPT